ncbi:hypothetical protein SUDANB58_05539 [Streptomyces sp. enrichment culture]|uniref:hypothetical protein n=1 Tax=Streptomyces sp. enrichment culture TaxID=1795815 RepID=UPI003F577D8B
MDKLSCVLLAVLAASVPAAPAVAAAPGSPGSAGRVAVRAPGGVTVPQCLQGGGTVVVELDVAGTGSVVTRCQGGRHHGRPVV